jgi:hypothetical protein
MVTTLTCAKEKNDTTLGDEVEQWTLYINDIDSATLLVCYCDQNKINAAAITKHSIFIFPFIREYREKRSFGRKWMGELIDKTMYVREI